MILDSSALVAVLLDEPDRNRMLEKMRDAAVLRISSVSMYEAAVVVGKRLGTEGVRALLELIDDTGIQIAAFDNRQALVAIAAYMLYGKGVSPAGLNFGDCPVYALATLSGMPILSTSQEFEQTGCQQA